MNVYIIDCGINEQYEKYGSGIYVHTSYKLSFLIEKTQSTQKMPQTDNMAFY